MGVRNDANPWRRCYDKMGIPYPTFVSVRTSSTLGANISTLVALAGRELVQGLMISSQERSRRRHRGSRAFLSAFVDYLPLSGPEDPQER